MEARIIEENSANSSGCAQIQHPRFALRQIKLPSPFHGRGAGESALPGAGLFHGGFLIQRTRSQRPPRTGCRGSASARSCESRAPDLVEGQRVFGEFGWAEFAAVAGEDRVQAGERGSSRGAAEPFGSLRLGGVGGRERPASGHIQRPVPGPSGRSDGGGDRRPDRPPSRGACRRRRLRHRSLSAGDPDPRLRPLRERRRRRARPNGWRPAAGRESPPIWRLAADRSSPRSFRFCGLTGASCSTAFSRRASTSVLRPRSPPGA